MKRLLIALLMVMMIITGCADHTNSNTEAESTEVTAPEATLIYIYYPQGNSVVTAEDRYQLKQPDMVAASVEELMTNISTYYEDRLAYGIYMLDSENSLTLEFTMIGEYDSEYYLLAKAAISRTLFQLPDINEIRFVLYAEDKSTISDEVLDRDAIYFYDEDTQEVK